MGGIAVTVKTTTSRIHSQIPDDVLVTAETVFLHHLRIRFGNTNGLGNFPKVIMIQVLHARRHFGVSFGKVVGLISMASITIHNFPVRGMTQVP